MCNKIKAHDPLKCPLHIHTDMHEHRRHKDTQTQLRVTWDRNQVRPERVTHFPSLSIFLPQLCTLSLDPHRLLLDHPLLTNTW